MKFLQLLSLGCILVASIVLVEAKIEKDGRNVRHFVAKRSGLFGKVGQKEIQVAKQLVKDFERDFGYVTLYKPVYYKQTVTEITKYTFKVLVAKARRTKPNWILIEAQGSIAGRLDYKGYKPITPESRGYPYKTREPYRYDYFDDDDDDDEDDDTDGDYSDDNTDLDTTDDEKCFCDTDDDDSSDDDTTDDEC